MSDKADKAASKLLSLVLRHDPGAIGLTLDAGGWADVDDLLSRTDAIRDADHLARIVADNNKQRFALSEDGTKVRANQGHSISVDLGLTPQTPPETLFHGTAETSVAPILAEGLVRGARQHVHLSLDVETARKVGQRHGKPVVLTVDAGRMVRDGFVFFRSENGVWLTDHVAPTYVRLLPTEA